MKAHINGITIEGTPAEIAEYQRIQEARRLEQVERFNRAAKGLTEALDGVVEVLREQVKRRNDVKYIDQWRERFYAKLMNKDV